MNRCFPEGGGIRIMLNLGIPAKPNAKSGMNPNDIPGASSAPNQISEGYHLRQPEGCAGDSKTSLF
jgi:hypothetical protein